MRGPCTVPAMSLANVARQLQPAMRYLNFSFKRVSGVTMDAEGNIVAPARARHTASIFIKCSRVSMRVADLQRACTKAKALRHGLI